VKVDEQALPHPRMYEGSGVTDVALHVDAPTVPRGGPYPRARHFKEPVEIIPDVYLGPLGKVGEAVMDACTARGENTPIPVRQYGARYALYRTNAPRDPLFTWDPDRRLRHVLQLSRIVRPHSIGTGRAARVIAPGEGGRRTIIPAWGRLDQKAYVVDEEANWIRDEDIGPIRELIDAFDPQSLPERVKRAMWHYEYAASVYWVDLRWTLLVTALESLIHTDERALPRKKQAGANTQFIGRLLTLAGRVPGLELDPEDLAAMYELRSGLAHGQSLPGGMSPGTRDLYLHMESALRSILITAIRDPAVAALFASDSVVREELPPSRYELARRSKQPRPSDPAEPGEPDPHPGGGSASQVP